MQNECRIDRWPPSKMREMRSVVGAIQSGQETSEGIAQTTGIPRPTVTRMLKALDQLGIVVGYSAASYGAKSWSIAPDAEIGRLGQESSPAAS